MKERMTSDFINQSSTVTQQDIADKLGISRTTVARALNGRNVSEKTRSLVWEEAEKMGYIPNNAAVCLALKTEKTIFAFIVGTIDEGYGQQMCKGIEKIATMWNGYRFKINIILTDIKNCKNQCAVQLQQFQAVMKQNSVDGVIFSALSQENMDEVTKACQARGIPLMTLDMIYRNNSLCHVGPNYYNLGTYSAAYMANLMMMQGRILTLSYDEGYELGVHRMSGFHGKLKEYKNIVCKNVQLVNMSPSYYRQILDEHLSDFDPVAIYAPYHVEYIGSYLKEHHLEHKIILISNGINEQVEQYLFDGTINGIVSARPYFLGAVVANNFFKYFFRTNEMLTGEIDVACDIYIKENYNRFDEIY